MNTEPETAEEWLEFVRKTRQTHHDIFVRFTRGKRERSEQLTHEEQAEYNLAMRREHEGLAKPLP
ncbi:hypothetical protein HYS03_00950 [Candidatus Woesebacteria bacterium]|nr:hypothetical protein [Candidatus Woesebacteria bacterium]QQG47223.1 MAG: hypothetical protein HY044_03765 [Candidatus Woesebacteria bacterium]